MNNPSKSLYFNVGYQIGKNMIASESPKFVREELAKLQESAEMIVGLPTRTTAQIEDDETRAGVIAALQEFLNPS